MAWTTPATWTAGQVVSETDLNAQVRDNLTYLATNYPTRATMWHKDSIVTNGNAIQVNVNTARYFNHDARQNAEADADEFTQSFILAAGTYTLHLLGTTDNDCGKIDWDLDGTGIATGQDWYSAGTTNNVEKTVAGVVVADAGRHVLTGTVNGKNASSSSYKIRLTQIWVEPASD